VSRGDLKLLEIAETEDASLKEQASWVSTEGLTRVMEVLTDSESRLREAASKKIFLEVALLKAIQAREAVQIDAVLKQLQQLRTEAAVLQPASAPPRAATKAAEPTAASAAQVATPQPAPASAGS